MCCRPIRHPYAPVALSLIGSTFENMSGAKCVYCMSSEKSLFGLGRPCSASLFDTLFEHRLLDLFRRPCLTSLFDTAVRTLFDNLVRNRFFLYERSFLQPCLTACSTSLFDLVRTLLRHPCSKLPRARQKLAFRCGGALFNRLFASYCTVEVFVRSLF